MFSLDPEMVASALGSARLATWNGSHPRMNFVGLQGKLRYIRDCKRDQFICSLAEILHPEDAERVRVARRRLSKLRQDSVSNFE